MVVPSAVMLQSVISDAETYFEGLSEHQAAFLRHFPCPQLFAIVSWGCAATDWVAATLNRHPDIFCTHAANDTWHYLGGCERLDGVRYLRVIGSQGHAHAAAGDVHGVSRHHVAELRLAFGDKFNATVVIREPLPRLYSQLAIYHQYDQFPHWDLDYLEPLMSRTRVRLPSSSYACRFFVHAANMLNAIQDEIEIGKIYRAEDLTRHPEALGELVDEITGGKVRPSAEWLQEAVGLPKTNGHIQHRRQNSLEDWQREVVRKVVSEKSWELYNRLGYSTPEFV